MKIFQIILFTTLVICIHNTCTTLEDISSYRECRNRDLNIGERALGGAYCCYYYTVEGSKEVKRCYPYSQNQYDNIDDTIKSIETTLGVKVKSLDCKSSYLQIGLLGLLFFLF